MLQFDEKMPINVIGVAHVKISQSLSGSNINS